MEVETDGTTDHPVIRTVIEMLDILGIYGDFESQYMASLRIEWSVPSIIELFYRDYSYRSLLHSTIKEYIPTADDVNYPEKLYGTYRDNY